MQGIQLIDIYVSKETELKKQRAVDLAVIRNPASLWFPKRGAPLAANILKKESLKVTKNGNCTAPHATEAR